MGSTKSRWGHHFSPGFSEIFQTILKNESQNVGLGVFTGGGHPQCVALYIWSHSQINREEVFISEDFKSSADVNVIY